jgi:hypothetical protein
MDWNKPLGACDSLLPPTGRRARRLLPAATALFAVALLLCQAPGVGRAQSVTLAGLWPNEDGRIWNYDAVYQELGGPPVAFRASLLFDGSAPMPGGVTVQNLKGIVSGLAPLAATGARPGDVALAGLSGFQRSLWIARPDLRPALQRRMASTAALTEVRWPFVLLGPAQLADGVGFSKTSSQVGIWRGEIANWSWWWLLDNLTVGARFDQQLVPDLASNVYLHAEVKQILPQATLPSGTFNNVLVMEYVVDYGQQTITDESGHLIGTGRYETRGTISFAMGVGPIHSDEEFVVAELDCPSGCPPPHAPGEVLAQGELTLREPSVPDARRSWGELKARY